MCLALGVSCLEFSPIEYENFLASAYARRTNACTSDVGTHVLATRVIPILFVQAIDFLFSYSFLAEP